MIVLPVTLPVTLKNREIRGPSLLTINLGAVAENYKMIRKVAPKSQVAGVLKANAYGLGVEVILESLIQQGADTFFVAHFEEALQLRELNEKIIIYALNGLLTATPEDFVHNNIRPVLNSLHDVKLWQGVARNNENIPDAALHFDTGMNRLGLGTIETERILQDKITLLSGINLSLIMSHFACADDPESLEAARQAERFAFIKTFFPNIPASLCNSYGVFREAGYHHDIVRPGMALYGLNPTRYKDKNPMRPVVGLQARILNIQTTRAGEPVGYSARYRTEKDEVLATVCLGYADGFFRSLSVGGKLYWNSIPCPIRGRVSMDLVTVSIDHITANPPHIGDMMEVLGPHQSVDDLAMDIAGNSSAYEVLTALGSRYQRIYI